MPIEHLHEVWQLSTFPFDSLPPRKDAIEHVFTGREDQMDLLLSLVTEPRGIFVTGIYGVGKTIFIYEAIRRLRRQDIFCIYSTYRNSDGLASSVLRPLAQELAKKDEALVYQILNPGDGRSLQPGELRKAITSVEDPMGCIQELMEQFDKSSVAPIIIIDDIDIGGAELSNIEQIVFSARQLLNLDYTVVLLGHPLGVTATLSSAANILTPVPLGPLSSNELVQMMSRYLSYFSISGADRPDRTFPFTRVCAEVLANAIADFNLTPRIFNHVSNLLLHHAYKLSISQIDEAFFAEHWPAIANGFMVRSLQDIDRDYLRIIYESGGSIDEDNVEAIEAIGGNEFTEYHEVRAVLQRLVDESILIERSDTIVSRLEIMKLFTEEFPYYR